MRYTECKMAPLAMEMVRDITENTVDFKPNYDGKETEPVVLPARFPNLLVNGSTGIAVGMATNIPTHNLREVASAVQWSLEHPEATAEELLEAAMERVKGPDFPNGALIVGRTGIEDAYRTGRGSVIMRAVVDIEEDRAGRTLLVVTELPHMVNPDNLALKIAELVNTGKLTGIADIRDDTSARTGQRLVIVLKRDAQPRVVLNNLYKHTQLQDTFGCNMLALVDDVPRTLRLDQFISYWVTHQIEVIQRRTQHRLDEAQTRRPHLSRPGQGARRAGRGDRADPAQPEHRRGRATGLNDAAGDRRAAGQRDPRHAAAPARRAGAAADHRPAGRASSRHRRPDGHPGQARAAAAASSATSSPRS